MARAPHTIKKSDFKSYNFSHRIAASHSAQENKTLEIVGWIDEDGSIWTMYQISCRYSLKTFETTDLTEAIKFYNEL